MRTVTDAAYAGDIVSRLRNWRGLHLAHGGDLFDEAADAIESLRREVRQQRLEIAGLREERRALLDADRPQPDRPEAIEKGESDRPKPIATPTPPSTPAECTVPPEWTFRPYWVDPPSGWRYGFPRLYDPATDGDMRAWMIANGYPELLANQGLACTFTTQTEGVG